MPYRIAGIDVHKKKLAVVVADVEVEDEYQFERRWYGSNPEHLRLLSEWLVEQQVEEVVMESTRKRQSSGSPIRPSACMPADALAIISFCSNLAVSGVRVMPGAIQLNRIPFEA